jgi:hypothetical protein
MPTVRISDWLKDQLEEKKAAEGHSSIDSVIRTLAAQAGDYPPPDDWRTAGPAGSGHSKQAEGLADVTARFGGTWARVNQLATVLDAESIDSVTPVVISADDRLTAVADQLGWEETAIGRSTPISPLQAPRRLVEDISDTTEDYTANTLWLRVLFTNELLAGPDLTHDLLDRGIRNALDERRVSIEKGDADSAAFTHTDIASHFEQAIGEFDGPEKSEDLVRISRKVAAVDETPIGEFISDYSPLPLQPGKPNLISLSKVPEDWVEVVMCGVLLQLYRGLGHRDTRLLLAVDGAEYDIMEAPYAMVPDFVGRQVEGYGNNLDVTFNMRGVEKCGKRRDFCQMADVIEAFGMTGIDHTSLENIGFDPAVYFSLDFTPAIDGGDVQPVEVARQVDGSPTTEELDISTTKLELKHLLETESD